MKKILEYNKIILILCSLFFIFSNDFLFAEDQEREPNILLFTQSSTDNTNITEEINTAITEKLRENDLNAIQVEDDLPIDELLESAGWLGAFFVIESFHSDEGASAILEVNCYSAWNRQLLVSIYSETQTAPPLEEKVWGILDRIIPVIISNLEIVKAEPPPGWDWWQEETVTEEQIPDPSPEPQVENEILTESESAEDDSSRFLAYLAGAPLLSTFESADYFRMGASLSFFGGYKFFDSFISLTGGGRFGWDHFKGKGLLISSINNFYYFGPELLGGLKIGSGGTVFLRFSTGISYFTIDSNDLGHIVSSLPYVSCGLGIEIPISGHFGFYYSGDYTMHFEESTVFTGFYPSFGISFKI